MCRIRGAHGCFAGHDVELNVYEVQLCYMSLAEAESNDRDELR
jgi:hypothetical protein